MNLGSMVASRGARTRRKRVGRGEGSGHGGTSGKGHKGQKARAGGYHRLGFEGGQMPLVRRLPKCGFRPLPGPKVGVVNLKSLKDFPAGTVIDREGLIKGRLVRRNSERVKVLGEGEVKVPLVFRGLEFSAAARKKVAAAGGTIEGTPAT